MLMTFFGKMVCPTGVAGSRLGSTPRAFTVAVAVGSGVILSGCTSTVGAHDLPSSDASLSADHATDLDGSAVSDVRRLAEASIVDGPSIDGSDRVDAKNASDASPAFDRDAVKAIVTAVAEYQLSLYTTTASNDWIDSTFYAGLMAAYRTTAKTSFLAAGKAWGAAHQWDLHPGDARYADNQACTQTYLEIFETDATPSNSVMYERARAAFDAMIAAPKAGRVEWYWCDALFMAPPALARVGASVKQTQYFDFMNTLYWDSKDFLYSPANALFFRDKNFFGTDTFWARGNGWVIAGIARILDYLPADDPHHNDFVRLLEDMSAALANAQDPKDGLWRSNLLHPEAFPNPETSGSGLFTFALAWGITHGVLDRATYLPVVKSAWEGLTHAVNADGRLGYVQDVADSPAAAGATETHPFGVGAFLLAGSEVVRL